MSDVTHPFSDVVNFDPSIPLLTSYCANLCPLYIMYEGKVSSSVLIAAIRVVVLDFPYVTEKGWPPRLERILGGE
jgi:hypothetical protein